MKRFMLAVALTCVFSVSAVAGEMPTIGVVAPTPNPVVTTAPGEMPTTGVLATVILAIITWPR